MLFRRWSLGLALLSAGWAGCAESHRGALPAADQDTGVEVQVPEQPTESDAQAAPLVDASVATRTDAAVVGRDASAPEDARVATSLVQVESALGGASSQSKSERYTMISRVAAPLGGGGAIGRTEHYTLQTGILALQDGEP